MWQGKVSLETSRDSMAVCVQDCSGTKLADIAVTVAVHARHESIIYVDTVYTSEHRLNAFGTCEIVDFINTDLLCDNSIYITVTSLFFRVFIRPLSTPYM